MNAIKIIERKEYKPCSFSVKGSIHEKYMGILDEVNEKGGEFRKSLKKLSINDLLEYMANGLDDKFKGQLFSLRLTGTAKLDLFRKRYESQRGPISNDEWIEIVIAPEFQKFKRENIDCLNIF